MFGSTIGPGEIALVLLIALVIFGPKRLPELGQGLGRGLRDFKRAVDGSEDEGTESLPAAAPVTTLVHATPTEGDDAVHSAHSALPQTPTH